MTNNNFFGRLFRLLIAEKLHPIAVNVPLVLGRDVQFPLGSRQTPRNKAHLEQLIRNLINSGSRNYFPSSSSLTHLIQNRSEYVAGQHEAVHGQYKAHGETGTIRETEKEGEKNQNCYLNKRSK